MPKRFMATERWDMAWYRELPAHHKCLWEYLTSKCDCAGAWEPDFHLASFQIGERVTRKDLVAFGDRVEWLPCGKLWLVGFVHFQYGKLSADCRPHHAVLERLDRYGLLSRVAEIEERVSKGLAKGSPTPKEKDQDKDKDREEGEGQ